MENTKQQKKPIALILLLITVILNLPYLILILIVWVSSFNSLLFDSRILFYCIQFLCMVFLGISLLKKNYTPMIFCFCGIGFNALYTLIYRNYYSEGISVFFWLYSIAWVIVCIYMILILITNKTEKTKALLKKTNLIIPILALISFARFIIIFKYEGFIIDFFYNMEYLYYLSYIILPIALFFTAKEILDQKENKSLQPAEQGAGTSGTFHTEQSAARINMAETEEIYCGMAKHILLCLFTFGIWYLIWIYRATKYLNRAPEGEQYNPKNKLLLCLFVPFYQIYWFYKHGQKLDSFMKAKKVNGSDMATLCLILGIFIPIVACILMQDKFNQLCTVTASEAATPEIADEAEIPEEAPKQAQAVYVPSEAETIENLKKYKELLDSGVITPEEFDAKKKQLLGL